MASRNRKSSRLRIGRVLIYSHHGAWWIYYRDGGNSVRRKVGDTCLEAEQVAAQLTSGAPTLLAFTPIGVPELRAQFLDYHEHVLRSSVGTVCRYRAATRHLDDFVRQQGIPPQAHQISPGSFAAYLRKIEVAPNGHKNTAKRRLRDKGIQFILKDNEIDRPGLEALATSPSRHPGLRLK